MTGVAGTGTSCGGAGRLIPIFTLTWARPRLGTPSSIKIVTPPKSIRRSIYRFLLYACRYRLHPAKDASGVPQGLFPVREEVERPGTTGLFAPERKVDIPD